MSQLKSAMKCVDFFCGGGGMSLGLSQAGIQIVGGLDNDPACRETYEANHPNSKFVLKDITELHPPDLANKMEIKRGDDNLLFVGCSPCQYWSIINSDKQKSRYTRNLLQDFQRFVEHYQPGFVLIENVVGIRNNKDKSGLAELLSFFYRNSYNYDHAILHARHYGVPQTRKRFVLVASRVAEVKIPEKKGETVTVRDTISQLPKIAAGDPPPSRYPLHRSAFLAEINIERLKLTPPGGLRENWMDKSELLIPAYDGKPATYFRENYGRMDWNKPAPTITTRFYSLGCGRFGHPDQNRTISLLEGAMLQTFPPDYQFKTKTFGATARLIGNAVPPKLANFIGKSLLEQSSCD